jgi:hypothetical protein
MAVEELERAVDHGRPAVVQQLLHIGVAVHPGEVPVAVEGEDPGRPDVGRDIHRHGVVTSLHGEPPCVGIGPSGGTAGGGVGVWG